MPSNFFPAYAALAAKQPHAYARLPTSTVDLPKLEPPSARGRICVVCAVGLPTAGCLALLTWIVVRVLQETGQEA